METKSIRTYLIDESIVFRKTKDEFGGLSNMAPGFSIKINDVVIPTAEHLYQACRFPDYPNLQWDIIQQHSPMNAKWVSRANTHLTRSDWEAGIRFKIMQWILEVKLSQNWNKFSCLLQQTGNKNIVEASPKDKVWGAVKDGNCYVGINALGRLLMHVRNEYVHKLKHKKCVQPLNIPNFLLFGHNIETICIDEYAEHDCTDRFHNSAFAH